MTMNSANNKNLAQILNEELKAMNVLVKILLQEQQILVDNTPNLLGSLSEEKNNSLSLLNELGSKKSKELILLNLSNDHVGMQSFIDSQTKESNIKSTWLELLELTKKAQEINKTNGLLINRQLNVNLNTLNVLQQTNSNENLYGADGQSKNKSSSGRGYVVG